MRNGGNGGEVTFTTPNYSCFVGLEFELIQTQMAQKPLGISLTPYSTFHYLELFSGPGFDRHRIAALVASAMHMELL
jgi:hypothetical protein